MRNDINEIIQIDSKRLSVFSPGKINLFLKVKGKRPDGYHEIVTLMCCIGLADKVFLTFGVEDISVSCIHPKVPEDLTNLACRAAELFFHRFCKNEAVKIVIDKQVPVAAGLGGGSSNAAAVLLGLNYYYGYPFSIEELMNMGFSIGADVPFFILKKPSIATGAGEKLQIYKGLSLFNVVLIYPGFTLSTAYVYKNLNLGLTKCKKINIQENFKAGNFNVKQHLCNDLEVFASSKYPGINEAKEVLIKLGANGSLMSGSGSVVFGLFSNFKKAQRAYNFLLQNKKEWLCYLTDMI